MKMLNGALASAIFYGVSSLAIMGVNKMVLTGYAFPSASVVALCQMVLTILILPLAKQLKIIEYPDISSNIVRKVFPLPLLFLANLVTGLGGTKRINLPMFTLLRRSLRAINVAWIAFVVGS
ncbi:hypothetical protein PTSG_12567 [Salpingoeca rosetta]|uniref:Sugar phosphate transporter domain-containing protein n=1 Tax=Salpingoeca rosetta (strain ATCC 50818 / BSB-021) TaxID=946362 RepID=F2UIZ6_SALR5|nr:uncharacterized protein PTSG_12567 [Salpingoeca rosetta]EGD76944.1 hypothetical protein PTSG_12567 [Salpingoeca rosetta]|eukprot:XP_004990784.1 hypothetical protein PTSG_12567 [Salpingoeca rosetta]